MAITSSQVRSLNPKLSTTSVSPSQCSIIAPSSPDWGPIQCAAVEEDLAIGEIGIENEDEP
jgi:hypothetical protein